MQIEELAREAINVLNQSPISDPHIAIKLPGKWGASKRKYLAGPKSPQGQIVREDHEGVMVLFEAIDILAWCVAQGVDVHIFKKEMAEAEYRRMQQEARKKGKKPKGRGKATEEQKKAQSERLKAKWQDPEYRAKMLEAQRKRRAREAQEK